MRKRTWTRNTKRCNELTKEELASLKAAWNGSPETGTNLEWRRQHPKTLKYSWVPCNSPIWGETLVYRIKKESKPCAKK